MGKSNNKSCPKAVFLKFKSTFGFTLAEVLVVVTIVGLLALLAALSIKPSVQIAKTRDAQRKSDLKKISTALEDYLSDHPCYPLKSEMECDPGLGLRPYLNKIPCDPLTRGSYPYNRPDGCSQFVIYSNLETERSQSYGLYNYAVTSPNLRIVPTGGGAQPSATPAPSLSPTTVPTSPQGSNSYGCFSGVCHSLLGEICQPTYLSYDCYNQCGTVDNPKNECK